MWACPHALKQCRITLCTHPNGPLGNSICCMHVYISVIYLSGFWGFKAVFGVLLVGLFWVSFVKKGLFFLFPDPRVFDQFRAVFDVRKVTSDGFDVQKYPAGQPSLGRNSSEGLSRPNYEWRSLKHRYFCIVPAAVQMGEMETQMVG